MKRIAIVTTLFLLLLAPCHLGFCQDFSYDKNIWPDDLKVNVSVMSWNGVMPPEELVEAFLKQDKELKSVLYLQLGKSTGSKLPSKKLLSSLSAESIVVDDLNAAPTLDSIEALNGANAIWIHGNVASTNWAAYLESGMLGKGKAQSILFTGTAFVAPGMYQATRSVNRLNTNLGLNLIPDTVITSLAEQKSGLAAIALNPRMISIAIPEDTGILLRGRKIRVLGKGKVNFQIMANERKPHRVMQFGESKSRRPNPYRELIDLTAWRRDAIDRTLAVFPPTKAATPNVENGTLMIVGGGGMPNGLLTEFVNLAGGKDAKLVFIPCSEKDEVGEDGLLNALKGKVASATQLHTKDRNKADTDDEFLKHLSEATGIWFGGGRQWNFVDSYYGTKAHKLMLDVLDRGGVIAGSSAGASIQGEYLARANPVGNFDIMAPGYERGLGFLPGVAIDQHFSQRRRQKDMTELVDTYPQLLGIGIDEATALIVQKSRGLVVGKGRVFFYDRNQPVVPGEDDFVALKDKQMFDLAKRVTIKDETEKDEDSSEDK